MAKTTLSTIATKPLTDADRDLMAAVGALFNTADAVPVSDRLVALLVDAERFDCFLEMLERVAPADDEPDSDSELDTDGEPYLGSIQPPGVFSQIDWAAGCTHDREIDVGDEREAFDPDAGDGGGVAFQMDQTEQIVDLSVRA